MDVDAIYRAMRFPGTLFVVLACVPLVGCPLAHDPTPIPVSEASTDQPLDELVARTLEQNLRDRHLSTETQGAWQILHGILAYGDRFTVETPSGRKPAIEYLLDGNFVDGFAPMPGDPFQQRSGVRMEMQPGTKTGQGHRDQWLAVLSQCDLPLETQLRSGETKWTLDDWIRQAEFDLPRNLELEFSWSLIALTTYRDTDHRWTARDGNEYAISDLVESELDQDISSSVCGGTHRLIGISMSLNKRRREGKPINGIWARADAALADAVARAKANQNPDGSYSVDYLHRTGWTRDLGEALGTTGHVLEFLAFASPDDTIRQPWVERTVRRLCQMLSQCRDVDLECGVLYHALHGLSEYQHRIKQIHEKT